jgi:hypothetical protein
MRFIDGGLIAVCPVGQAKAYADGEICSPRKSGIVIELAVLNLAIQE